MPTLTGNITPLSLQDLLNDLQQCIADTYDENVWVKAEISELVCRGSGHCYGELVQHDELSGELLAKVPFVIWRNNYQRISAAFREILGAPLSPGMQVLLEVSLSYHPVYGLKLVVASIDPTYTVGSLARQRNETINRLRAEGVYDDNRSLPIPMLIRRVAVVSSATAAGYQDFCRQLEANNLGIKFYVSLFEASVQGDTAAASMCKALNAIVEQAERFDVVVFVRGGGATTDMSCFDDYSFCYLCTQMPLPLLSGVGHDKDQSVLDGVAAVSVKTPTAAAQWLLDRAAVVLSRINQARVLLSESVRIRLQLEHNRCLLRQKDVQQALEQMFSNLHKHLDVAQAEINVLSPEAVLKRGYAIALHDGQVASATNVVPGDSLELIFYNGKVQTIIQEKYDTNTNS